MVFDPSGIWCTCRTKRSLSDDCFNRTRRNAEKGNKCEQKLELVGAYICYWKQNTDCLKGNKTKPKIDNKSDLSICLWYGFVSFIEFRSILIYIFMTYFEKAKISSRKILSLQRGICITCDMLRSSHVLRALWSIYRRKRKSLMLQWKIRLFEITIVTR